MTITDLVAPEAILPALKVNSKKQAIQELAARAASLSGQNERAIFEVLLQREKLGTTAVGYGVAIPHGKLPKLEKLFGLFARLERPIDFEAMDGQPVDLVFLLLAPEGAGADHLKALARIARLLRDQDVAKKLRASRDAPRSIRCWRCRLRARRKDNRFLPLPALLQFIAAKDARALVEDNWPARRRTIFEDDFRSRRAAQGRRST